MKLRAREGGREIELQAGLVVGRAEDCGAVLADDSVSRHHARFERREDAWWVVDLGSSNGTRVNGQRTVELALRSGDLLTVGALAFDVLAAAQQAPPPEVPSGEAGRAASAASAERARLRAQAREMQRSRGLGDLGQQRLAIQLFAVVVALAFLVGIALGVRWLGHALSGS